MKTGTRKLLVAVTLLLSSMAAKADFIEIDITPTPGSWYTMTGSFDYDAASNSYSNMVFNITGDIGPYSFNDALCENCPKAGNSVGLIDPAAALNFLSDLWITWAGGDVTAIFRGNSIEIGSPRGRIDGEYRFVVAAQPVPEPGALALFCIGLAGLGLFRRRRSA